MVWCGERNGTHRHQARAWIEHAGDAMNLGRLQRFFEGQRRHDGGHALGQHGLAAARRSDHQDVVPAGAGDLDRALGRVLSAHIFEIHAQALALAEQLGGRDLHGSYAVSGVDELHHFHQRAHGKDIHAVDHRRLASVDLGHQQVGDLLGTRRYGDRQRAADAPQAAIERQLAHHHVIVQLALVQSAIGAKDAERHRQIESRSLFLHVRGSQIDRDVSGRNVVAGILQRRANPLAALANGGIGQAHGREVVFTKLHARNIDFDIDQIGVDAVNGGGKCLEEHKSAKRERLSVPHPAHPPYATGHFASVTMP